MTKTGILNPALASLLRRVRHTNTIVIADRGFPFWPEIETVDISLIDNIPSVLEVLKAVTAEFEFGKAWIAEEFTTNNDDAALRAVTDALGDTPLVFEQHDTFKLRVPKAIGLIRTGDTVQYANMILESA